MQKKLYSPYNNNVSLLKGQNKVLELASEHLSIYSPEFPLLGGGLGRGYRSLLNQYFLAVNDVKTLLERIDALTCCIEDSLCS